ncbi:histidine kinase [Streptomyces sp. PmtG]
MGRGRGSAGGEPRAAAAVVPALLVAGHVAAVALQDVLGPDRGPAWPSAAGFLAVLLAAAALVWRAVAPVPVLAATLTADAAAAALLPASALTPALPAAVWVALFSLAARGNAPLGPSWRISTTSRHLARPLAAPGESPTGSATRASAGHAVSTRRTPRLPPRRSTSRALTLAGAALATAAVPLHDTGPLLDGLLAGALLHLVIVVCGRLHAHRKDRRARVLARLADVERERRAAAAAERERLARDLHDLAGHHLTAIAVQGAAALRLADSRPELADEALAAGAASGRDVLTALGALVAAVSEAPGDGAPHDVLPPLCASLARLGVPVSLALEGRPVDLPPDTRVAAYRVVQEALTNAMRYAPGAAVAVQVRHEPGAVRITVVNAALEPADGAPPGTGAGPGTGVGPGTGPGFGPGPGPGLGLGPGLGGGRGLVNLAERVAAVGGRLSAGPGERGGWTVAATLPAPAPRPARAWWPRAVDLAAVTVCTVVPLLAVTAAHRPGPAGLAALTALSSVHAAPLLLRRRAPATVLAALLAVSLVWSAATAAGALDFAWLGALALAWPAELVALHAVGAYGPARATWPAPVAVGVVGGTVLGLAVASDPAESAGPGTVALIAALGLATVPWLLPVWALGLLTRARRGEGGRWERRVLDAVAARVGDAVTGERAHVAAGLHGTVVAHTAHLVRRAEAGLSGPEARAAALTDMTAAARAALTGLRELLDTLDGGGALDA